jgi:putative transposase
VLASVPHKARFLEQFEGLEGERRLLGHLRSLYSKRYVELLEADLRRWRESGDEVRVQQKLESFKGRMADLSRFVKEVKERFSRWYNKRHERKGTLWMDRFKSVLVEDKRGMLSGWKAEEVDAVKAMAAYIDLNPVRAGLVEDSREYAWCGYGEACAGKRRAQRGLCRVLELPVDGWGSHHGANGYLNLLLGVDWETGTRRSSGGKNAPPKSPTGGIQAKKGGAESPSGKGGDCLPKEGRVSLGELLRSRVRDFSEGLVLGSQAFVDEVFQANRRFFGEKRKEGARRMRRSEVPFFVAKRTGKTGSDGGN